jgi:hypothetical protein
VTKPVVPDLVRQSEVVDAGRWRRCRRWLPPLTWTRSPTRVAGRLARRATLSLDVADVSRWAPRSPSHPVLGRCRRQSLGWHSWCPSCDVPDVSRRRAGTCGGRPARQASAAVRAAPVLARLPSRACLGSPAEVADARRQARHPRGARPRSLVHRPARSATGSLRHRLAPPPARSAIGSPCHRLAPPSARSATDPPPTRHRLAPPPSGSPDIRHPSAHPTSATLWLATPPCG